MKHLDALGRSEPARREPKERETKNKTKQNQSWSRKELRSSNRSEDFKRIFHKEKRMPHGNKRTLD